MTGKISVGMEFHIRIVCLINELCNTVCDALVNRPQTDVLTEKNGRYPRIHDSREQVLLSRLSKIYCNNSETEHVPINQWS